MCAVGPSVDAELEVLRNDVMEFACSFPTVGFTEDEMEYEGEYHTDIVA